MSFAGPIAFVMTVLYWALSLIFGFAMIYWPHLPEAFTFASGLNPENYRTIKGAINRWTTPGPQSQGAKLQAQFPGACLKWIYKAEPEFERRHLVLEHYTVSVLEQN